MTVEANDHDTWRDSAALYALDALTGDERRAFEAHLQSCADCAVELLTLRPAAGALTQAVPQLDPRSELKERVMSAALSEPSPQAAPDRVVATAPKAAPIRVEGRTISSLRWLSLAAMFVLTVGLAAYSNTLRERVARLEEQLNVALSQSAELQARVDSTQRTLASAQTQLDVLTAPDATRIALAGQAPAPMASGRADWSRSRGLALSVSNLPPLQPKRTYQVWLLTSGAPVSAGFVQPDEAGRFSMIFPVRSDVEAIGVALSEEPEGGSQLPVGPSGQLYLVGTIGRNL